VQHPMWEATTCGDRGGRRRKRTGEAFSKEAVLRRLGEIMVAENVVSRLTGQQKC